MFKLNLAKRKIYLGIRTLVFLLAFIIVPIALAQTANYFSMGTSTTGYKAIVSPAGGLVNIWDGSCRKIINVSTKELFIPTKNKIDWDAFEAHHPAGVTVISCAVCTISDPCCDATGQFKLPGTVCGASTGICDPAEKCTGLSGLCPSNTLCPTNQYWNGASCIAGNCLTSGSCASPVANNTDGSCNPYYTTQVCNGSSDLCTGTTTNNYCYGISGQVWWSNVYQTGSATIKCNATVTANSCSGQQPQGDVLSCNGAGACTVTGVKVNVGSACTGGENSMCVDGACVNKCSNLNGGLYVGDAAPNGDGDGYADVLDPDCGGCGQCTAGDCCNISTGCFLTANTVIGTCGYCTGASDTSVDQGSTRDLGNQCSTGATGTGTVCQSPNCAASGRACGYLTSATTCSAASGICDAAETCTGVSYACPSDSVIASGTNTVCDTCAATGEAGACSITDTGYRCDGTVKTCGTGNSYTCPANTTLGNIWNGSAFTAATCALSTSAGATYSCSGATPQRSAYGCNASGGADLTTVKATCSTGTTYPGAVAWSSSACTNSVGGEGASVCVNGQSACQNLCVDGIDNDGDGFKDGQDTDCGGYGQCLAGDCCNIATGQITAINTVIGTCGKCTGALTDVPTKTSNSINQTASEDLGGQCVSGENGSATSCQSNNCSGTSRACGYLSSASTCRSSAGVCDVTETCSGSAFTCPTDQFLSGNTCNAANGVCDAPELCTGVSALCPNDTFAAAGTNTVCDTCAATGATGACNVNDTGYRCDGTVKTCGTGNSYTCPANATLGNIWNGSVFTAATCALSTSAGATYSCSGATIQRSAFGCATNGSPDLSTIKATCTSGTTYPGGAWSSTTCSKSVGGEGASVCVNGQGSCQNLCADGIDNDNDGNIDAADTDCGAQCLSGDCCNLATHMWYSAGYCPGTCNVCSGSSDNSTIQTSGQDTCNQCTTGASGSATSCQSNTCSGSGASCGMLTSALTCRTSVGICDNAEKCTGSAFTCPSDVVCSSGQYWNGSACAAGSCTSSGSCASPVANATDGSCNPYWTSQICSGSASNCSGTTTNNYCYGTSGQVWWANAYQTGSTTIKCNTTVTANSCSGQQPQGDAMYCNAAGSCSVTGAKVNVGAACGGGENSMCVDGACVNKCANLNGSLYVGDAAPNGDGDGYADAQDSDCNGGSQCTSGDCCDIPNGRFIAANIVIGTCGYCTGSSNVSADQGSSRDLGSQCATGALGSATSCESPNCAASGRACGYLTSASTCRASAGVCDKADTCSGSAFTCADTYCPAGQYWNGSACAAGNCTSSGSCAAPVGNTTSGSCNPYWTSATCTGTAATCTGTTTNNYCYGTSGQVWWGGSWQATTGTIKCGNSADNACSSITQKTNNTLGCNGGGTCNVQSAYTNNSVTTCSGGEDSMCDSGVCTNKCSNTNGTGQYVGDTAPNGDGDGYADAQDSDCGGSQQCTTGLCCTTATAAFKANTTICSTGVFNTPALGSCSRTATDQYCPGNGANCTGTTNNRYDYSSVGNIWNGSAWTAATCALSTSAGAAYSCSSATIQRSSYGCSTSGGSDLTTAKATCTSGTTYPGGAWSSTTCSKSVGGEGSSVCVNGQSACQNLCADGIDNDGDGFKNGQDTDCGGCGQCSSGACCNTATGCFLGNTQVCRAAADVCDTTEFCTGGATSLRTSDCPSDSLKTSVNVCLAGSCASPSGGSGCSYTYNNQYCSGSASACNGTVSAATPYPCYCGNGTVWNGSSCATPSDGTLKCGTGSSYSCYSWYGGSAYVYQSKVNTLSCNGSGTCNVNTGYTTVDATCSAPNPVCVNSTGRCGQCNAASDCGLNALTNISCAWPAAQAQYQTFSCTNATCSNSLGSVMYHTCLGNEVCAGSYYGIQSVSALCGPGYCSDGYYLYQGSCVRCPIGTWTVWYSGAVLTECGPCPPGSYANTEFMQCTTCPQNYFCTGGAYLQTCASIASVADPRYYSAPASTGSWACSIYQYSG